MRTSILISAVLVLALALVPSGASAQNRMTLRFEEEIIRGKVHKPEVMVVITRQNLQGAYTLELRESFLPKIVRSVETPPF